jgi:predicted nucleic-acid-binding Zn-ribbon protein
MAKFDSNKIIEHLKEKWFAKPCPMCGGGPWNVQDSTFQLTEFNEGNLILGGPVIPIIPVTCGNCGYTALVNAIVAGIHKGDSKPIAEEEPK